MRIAARWVCAAWLAGIGCAGLASTAAAAGDPFVGTWVLNLDKSKVPPGTPAPSSATMVVTEADGQYKSVSDTSMANTNIHVELTFATDGKDYTPVLTPAPPPGTPTIAESFERVGKTSYKTTLKMNGQPIATELSEVSGDGKTLTVTTTGLGAAANLSNVAVFDKK